MVTLCYCYLCDNFLPEHYVFIHFYLLILYCQYLFNLFGTALIIERTEEEKEEEDEEEK